MIRRPGNRTPLPPPVVMPLITRSAVVNRCDYCKVSMAKFQSSSTVKIAFAWILLRTFFVNCVRVDLRESVDISFLNT